MGFSLLDSSTLHNCTNQIKVIMAKYKATVCRTAYGFTDIEVEANSKEEAEKKILDEAGDHLYSEKSSEFTLDSGAIKTEE